MLICRLQKCKAALLPDNILWPITGGRRRSGGWAFILAGFGRRGVKMFKTESEPGNLASLGTGSTEHFQQCTDMRCRDQFMRYTQYLGSHGACSRRHTEECSVLPHTPNTLKPPTGKHTQMHPELSIKYLLIFCNLSRCLLTLFSKLCFFLNGGCMHLFHFPVSSLTIVIFAIPYSFLFFFGSCVTVREPQW